ncbi:sacsin-like [Saccostrea echinata]|uniref:sacsin-like n=1 Tax=Saccostrea echinata TaxID=191078 RepID=UPI002A831510|nr:sacsin-like [Saccostrea echinata]
MPPKVKYKPFKRNTLLEELQSILHEYPDNEQIIKELLQNAEDSGASVVKMGFCPSSNADYLPDPYRKYLSGPALCFYNDAIFEEEDWDGITMVRKSNKQDDPLKVGKFGIGFKSVFHITDFVCVISGENILFIDPLREQIDPNTMCPFNTIEEFTDQEICGKRGLEPLYGLFEINEKIVEKGLYDGTFFWFPLRKSASELSENIYTQEKVEDLFNSLKEEIGIELLFLTSVEELHVCNMSGSTLDTESSISVDRSTSWLDKMPAERSQYKEKIREIERELSNDDSAFFHNDPILLKTIVQYKIHLDSQDFFQKWLVVQYFHTGSVCRDEINEKLSQLVKTRHCKYRPYLGIAARLDSPTSSGRVFCFLPLPSTNESPTGLPVHVNGYFALDSNRQHLKWPSLDQTASNSHLEKDMDWNVLLVHNILPIVYREFLNSWSNDLKTEMETHLGMFYQYIPRVSKVDSQWRHVCKGVEDHLIHSEIPCLEKKHWIKFQDAFLAVFQEDVSRNVQSTVKRLFDKCTKKTVIIENYSDLYNEWEKMSFVPKCTNPKETLNILKIWKNYEQMSSKEKEDLLIYCCSDRHYGLSNLDGIKLVPVANGDFKIFSSDKAIKEERIYLCEENELEILIGMEGYLVKNSNTELGNVLKSLAASELYNFQILDENDFLRLLTDVAPAEESYEIKLIKGSGKVFGDKWLQKVWNYLKIHCQNTLSPVAGMPLVKTKGCDVLRKLSDAFISEENIEFSMRNILGYFNIWIIDTAFHDHPLLQPGKGIVLPSSDNGKEKILLKCIEKGMNSLNSGSSEEKELFKTFLPNTVSPPLINAVGKLEIFKCFSNVQEMVSYAFLKECCHVYVGNEDFPVSFPCNMIIASSKHEETLLLRNPLSVKVTLNVVVEKCLSKMNQDRYFLKEKERRNFCFYVLEMHSSLTNWISIQRSIADIKFIENRSGHLRSPHQLYDPDDDILKDLFLEESKFPSEALTKETLLKSANVQFLTRTSATLKDDIVATCKGLHEKAFSSATSLRKAKALNQILNAYPNLFDSIYSSIERYNIMQYQTNRPEDYPRSLKWYSGKEILVSLKEICSEECGYLMGSIFPTALKDWENLVLTKPKAVPLKYVIQHFIKVTECYCEEELDNYRYVVKKIYQYLSKQSEVNIWKNLLPDKCILTEQGFMKPESIYIERYNNDLNLTPYFFPLEKEYGAIQSLFKKLGCNTKQTADLLIETLHKINSSHSSEMPTSDSKCDLKIVQNILKTLAKTYSLEVPNLRHKIIVPIHQKDDSYLVFRRSEECAYCESDWFSRTFTDEDYITLVHSQIDKEDAKAVGVRSLKELTLSDAEDIITEFGQSEPLTSRLNRLLEEGYTDGLSVPKELIQNADDAGASEVCFLYDERENENARSCLLDQGMESCQGPALWAFNNADFTPEDFENIQKLSGATKRDDETKIGRFGLGFNAVYNLTDVPSFLSGKYLVYLDPHRKYLGNTTLNEKSPGIKLNLHNKVMLEKFENQFKPYYNVFGFVPTELAKGNWFSGTLFRFPLRTNEQAKTSEILQKAYTRNEVEKLLKVICKSCGNMLLFTQNVKVIKIFHLKREGKNPDEEMELVLSVQKEEKTVFKTHAEESFLACAAKLSDKLEGLTTICKTRITIKGMCQSWLGTTERINHGVDWILVWTTGKSDSLQLYKKKKSDGALPISSVAVPIENIEENAIPLLFYNEFQKRYQYGFFDTGHLFCFLPLPIQTGLNFHVNGIFALSSDRKRLVMQSEDDKEISGQSVWNTSVISDATLEAVLLLLLDLKDRCSESYNYTMLWPDQCSDGIWEDFQRIFYKALAERPLALFRTHFGWKSFQECVFLHPDVCADVKLKNIAFNILQGNHSNGRVAVDLPNNFFSKFEKFTGTDFKRQVITYEHCITELFLPYLSNFQGQEYDEIVIEAIQSGNSNILAAIKESECITTLAAGIRKAPGNLVHPKSSLKEIFLPDEEFFPENNFCKGDVLDILVDLGMMKEQIPWELLLLRAKSVILTGDRCSSCALTCSNEILKHIHNFFDQLPDETREKLSYVKFLPSKEKPKDWQWKWYTGTLKQTTVSQKCTIHRYDELGQKSPFLLFEKPSNLFFQSNRNLVACTEAILDFYTEEDLYSVVLKSIGVKCKSDIKQQTLKLQLQEVIENSDDANDRIVEEVCFAVYEALEEKLTKGEWHEFVENDLSMLPCILISKTFVNAKKVFFSLGIDCSPYIYGIEKTSLGRYSKLMKTLGVREEIATEEIIQILSKLEKKYEGKQLSDTDLSLTCNIIKLLEDSCKIPSGDIYLPDTNGHLRLARYLCMNDFKWIPEKDSMYFLHEKISPKVATLAGIKSKREHSILEDSEDIGYEFGQHEDLKTRIRSILDGYPDTSILQELLQNADDAGASELHFIIDQRSHGTENVFSDNWAEIQRPALCVYNDSIFTEHNFQGIQNLGIGSKREDPTATGQYGIGFNVVYHLTDVPSFLTKDSSKSLDTLCILDPHCKYILSSSLKKPGRMFPNASKTVKVNYVDIMPCYLEDTDIWKNFRGTLFRFPLRQRCDSELSTKTYSIENIERMFEDLQEKVPECLLFLHNVRSIIFSKITISGSLERMFYVDAKCENILPSKVSLFSLLGDSKKQMVENPEEICKIQQKVFKCYLEMDINGLQTQKWLLVNGFGFNAQYSSIPFSVREAYKIGRLALLPFAGVAVFIKNENIADIDKEASESQGREHPSMFKAFCILPLPNATGLPMHINGHFAIDSETRKQIFWVPDDCNSIKQHWNTCLINNVLVPTYVSAVEHVRDMLFSTDIIESNSESIERFYKVFPNNRNIGSKICEFIAKKIYEYLFQNDCNVLPIFNKYDKPANSTTTKYGKCFPYKKKASSKDSSSEEPELLRVSWESMVKVTLNKTYSDKFSVKLNVIPALMNTFGMQIVEPPKWIFDSIKQIGLDVNIFSPISVISFLKKQKDHEAYKFNLLRTDVPVEQTGFKDCETVCSVLNFCVGSYSLPNENLENVPLLLTADGFIRVFSTDRKVLLTSFPNLFPMSASLIAHEKELHILRNCNSIFLDFIEELRIENFSEHLSENFGKEMCGTFVKQWCPSSEMLPNKQWMYSVWKFLSEQFSDFCFTCKRKETYHICTRSKEQLLKEFSDLLLLHLERCNILPVTRGNNGLFIFPLRSGSRVLLTRGYKREHQALLNMNVPLIDLECIPNEGKFAYDLLHNLVADMNNVFSVLECLQCNSSSLICDNKSVDTILTFLKDQLEILRTKEESKQKLRNLPIYFSISDTFKSVKDRKVILLTDEIPKNGLLELGDVERVIFLPVNKTFCRLYEFLEFTEPSKYDLYIMHIIPKFELLPTRAFVEHLEFIRDNLLPHLLNTEIMKEKREQIRKLLKETAFLMREDRHLARACEFYNPHEVLFKFENQLSLASELPPKPFNKKVWEKFLIFSGMMCEINITADIFIAFAKRLQSLADNTGINDIVENNSSHLLKILFTGPFNFSEDRTILRKVRELRIICPHKMDDICLSFLKQYTDSGRLICYSEATLPSNGLIAWSQMNIISNKADPSRLLQDSLHLPYVMVELNIRNPTLQSVVAHIQTFCSSLQPLLEQLKYEIVEKEVANIMQEAYEYLSLHGNAWSIEILSAVPFVFLKERKILTTPNRVVLNLRETDEIFPYLCKASAFFGQYQELFKKYGAEKDAKSSHYAKVLYEIKSKSSDRELNLDELKSVQTAIKAIFSIRRSENIDVHLGVRTLYLLTKASKLEDSKEMVFIDNILLQRRIGVNMPTISFFIGFNSLQMDVKDQMSEIKLLPEKVRPQLLSRLVTEVLEVNSSKTIIKNSVTALCLEAFICSPEFLEGIYRIILDKHSRCDMSFSEAEQLTVERKLKNISFTQLEYLTTVLEYDDKVLPNTEETNTVFAKRKTIASGEMLSIYFTMCGCTSTITWMNTNSISISTQINDYLDNILGDRIIFLPKILECFQNAAAIPCVLDSLKIMKSDGSIPGPTVQPETLVPVPALPPSESEPQHEEAKRWIFQAEKDFVAASNDCFPDYYNWACYKCHQAAEKALKALWYETGGIERVHSSHNLKELLPSIADISLRDLINQLEGVTGNYFGMRYPDAVSRSCIPSELYTESDATTAKELTNEILQIVKNRLSRH